MVELRKEVGILRSEIERYQQMVKEKDNIYQQLQNDYVLIDEQRTRQETEIMNLKNERSILNREIERFTTTIAEKESTLTSMATLSAEL